MVNLHFNPEASVTNSVMISIYLILLHLLHIFRHYKARQSWEAGSFFDVETASDAV